MSESGPVRLWSHVEAAHEQWTEVGAPEWSRLGLTVTPSEQRIWLDTPDSGVTWLLPV